MKTKEELNEIKKEVEDVSEKLIPMSESIKDQFPEGCELSEDEAGQVVGGNYKDYENSDNQGTVYYGDPGISLTITEHLGYCSYCKNWTFDYSKNRCQICGDPTAVGEW